MCRVHSISRCGGITERTERTEYDEGNSPGVAKLSSKFGSGSFGHYFQIFQVPVAGSGCSCRFIVRFILVRSRDLIFDPRHTDGDPGLSTSSDPLDCCVKIILHCCFK